MKTEHRILGLQVKTSPGSVFGPHCIETRSITEVPGDEIYQGRIDVELSPEQASRLISTLWALIPPNQRPIPG